jgi:hypothetical protein
MGARRERERESGVHGPRPGPEECRGAQRTKEGGGGGARWWQSVLSRVGTLRDGEMMLISPDRCTEEHSSSMMMRERGVELVGWCGASIGSEQHHWAGRCVQWIGAASLGWPVRQLDRSSIIGLAGATNGSEQHHWAGRCSVVDAWVGHSVAGSTMGHE